MNKLKRIVCAVFAALILSAHFCVFAGIENGQAVIVADNVSGVPGQSVEMNLTLTKNPGITGLRFFVTYDAKVLTLKSAVYTKIGGGGLAAVNTNINPFVLLWNVSTYEFTETGVMAKLTFEIKEGVSVGDYPIRITYNPKGDCIDYNLKNLDMNISGGMVHIDYYGTNCEHKSASRKITRESTCTESGTYDVVCNACSSVVGSGVNPVTEHSYGALIVTKLPTYTEVGLKEQKCSVCGDVRTEPIDILNRPEGYVSSIITTLFSPSTTAPDSTNTQKVETQKNPNSQNGTDTSPSVPQGTDTATGTHTPQDSESDPEYPQAPADTSCPATGDDTAVLYVLSAISTAAIGLLVFMRIKERKKFK